MHHAGGLSASEQFIHSSGISFSREVDKRKLMKEMQAEVQVLKESKLRF
jgi:hypothetical protein